MRVLLRVLAGLLVLVLLASVAAWWTVRRTLAPDDERRQVRGIAGPVTILYDSLGVPTVRANTLDDLAFGQGWAHARDRRFQMELIRRSAAGRLSEVFGAIALDADREKRRLGFGALADSMWSRLGPSRRSYLEAYAAGVCAWDAAHARCPEMLALGMPVEPWRPQDYALVLAAMYYDLNFDGEAERMVETMDAALPAEIVSFLTPDRTPGDVGNDGPIGFVAAPIPPPAVFDARADSAGKRRRVAARRAPDAREVAIAPLERGEPLHGSNNWAIGPSRTASGRAILCGDPHLGLRVPVIWHRQRLEGAGLAITGVTLPGTPGVVIGANGSVAWSFTNVEGDFIDWVRVRPADPETTTYATAEGSEPFRIRREIIRVKGLPAETLDVRVTRWGPVMARSVRGGMLAIQWVGLDPANYDFDLVEPNRAADVATLFAAFDGYRGPAQNVVAADARGHIGWRIAGRVPRRTGFDPRRPRDGDAPGGWLGELPQSEMPRVVDPAAGFIATANNRTLGGPEWRRIGDAAAMPWRARRIHDVLAARSGWTIAAAESLQNDIDDALLGETAAALDRALTPPAAGRDSTRGAARRLLDRWEHRADTTSASHAFLRYARVALHELLLEPFVAPCLALDSTFAYTWNFEDEVVRRLLIERPPHLLAPRFASYDELALVAADSAAARLRARFPGVPLERITWGMLNRSRIRHPLGAALKPLAKWLDMPDVALNGGGMVVRVARPANGASMRLVAEPGGEARFILPGGQSGNFLSKHYADEYADWVAGRYGPLHPGRDVHRIELTPKR